MEVAVSIRTNVADVEDVEKEIAAALRARLAIFVTVVPEGVTPPPDAVRLDIEIDRIVRSNVSPAAAGVATGAAVAVLRAASSGRREHGSGIVALLEGLYWGLMVASDVDDMQRHRTNMLGYVPPRINGLISLGHPEKPSSIYTDKIPARAVIDEMAPLRDGERFDYASINEEVARAFARAVTNKLQQKFSWYPKRTPSWYEPLESQRGY